MPSVYAHERFGWQVLKRLPEPIKAVVEKHRRQFGIGLQGPDFFFFYKAWKSTPVAELGLRIHRTPASELFSGFREILRKSEQDSMEMACAIGTVCHFMLDSTCHWYVDEQMRFPVWKFIPVDEDTVDCLTRLYGRAAFAAAAASMTADVVSMDKKIVRTCLTDMRLIKRLLSASTPMGQKLLRRVMGMTGHYDEIQGHLMALTPNPRCARSSRRLLELSDGAVEETAALITEYYENIWTDKPLNSRFDKDFE